MEKRKTKHGALLTTIFSIISVVYMFPILLVLMNSFKKKAYISRKPFAIPSGKMYVGLDNYFRGVKQANFFEGAKWSLVITVGSVFLILLCTSMCAWYIVRVKSIVTSAIYYLCLFAMIVPFQMEMFTLSKLANTLKLNTPWGLWIIYLGFGAGLAVFMFTGFVKSIPLEIEEAAMIDGCGPLRTFFLVVMPMLKPTLVSVGILETMWVWNDYLLPYLVLDGTKYMTIPILIQYFRGGFGRVEMGPMMACIVLTILPIIIIYVLGQKHIIKGVAAGAVKG